MYTGTCPFDLPPSPPGRCFATMPQKPSAGSSYTSIAVRGRGRSFCSVLYGRQHKSKAGEESLVAGRTLFLANVPHGAGADALRTAFSSLGEVTHVQLGMLGSADVGSSSVATAHVVFAHASALKKALAYRASQKPLQLAMTEPAAEASGVESREELQRSVDEFMRRFEAEESRRQEEADAEHNRMDSDGFVVVAKKRKGRSTSTDASGATAGPASEAAQAAAAARREKKAQKKGVQLDFYQFQHHERKREQLVKLREQFEADKARIDPLPHPTPP